MIILLQLFIEGIAVGSLYALAAIGFALIYSTTRTFHFAHGGTLLLAAYAYYQTLVVWHWPVLLCLLAALLVALLFGAGTDRLVYQPMRRTNASFLTIFAASFGLLIIATNVIALTFGSSFYTIDSTLSRSFVIGLVAVSRVDLLAMASAIVLILLLQWFIRRTRTGVVLRAMMDDPQLVGLYGFGDRRYSTIAFLIGSALIVPSAVLMTYISGLQPSIGAVITLIAIVGAILGGIGNLWGAALGGLILGIAENVGVWQLSSSWKPAITFGILLLVLMLRPGGLLARHQRET